MLSEPAHDRCCAKVDVMAGFLMQYRHAALQRCLHRELKIMHTSDYKVISKWMFCASPVVLISLSLTEDYYTVLPHTSC